MHDVNDMNEITVTLRELIKLILEFKKAKWNTLYIGDDTLTFFTVLKAPPADTWYAVDEWIGIKKDGNDITILHKNNESIKTIEQLISWVKGEGK